MSGNIVKHKMAEEALKDSEQRFKSVFDHANIMIFGTDKKGTIKYINKNAEEVLGYSPGEALGMNNMILHPPEQREEIVKKFQVHVSGELKDNLELEYITKSGKRLIEIGRASCRERV